MTYIWSPEALQKLFPHQSIDVQVWAISKAFELYPDQLCDRIISRLPEFEDSVALMVLRRIANLDLPVNNPTPLLRLVHNEKVPPEVRTCAGALLINRHNTLLPEELEIKAVKAHAGLIGTKDAGFKIVLQNYSRIQDRTADYFYGLASICSFEELQDELTGIDNKKELKHFLQMLRDLWKFDIPRLEDFKQDRIIDTLDSLLTQPEKKDDVPWKQCLFAELEQDRQHLRALLDAAGETAGKWTQPEERFFLAAILCLYRNEVCSCLLINAADVYGLWNAVVLKPWHRTPDPALKDFLAAIPPAEVNRALAAALSESWRYAEYGFDLLNTLSIQGRIELFWNIYLDETSQLRDEAEEALLKAGPPSAEYVLDIVSTLEPEHRVKPLFIIDHIPTPCVVDYCLEHFTEYVTDEYAEEFYGTLEEIASAKFLEPLLGEWRAGELELGRTILLIAEANGIEDERLKPIVRDIKQKVRPQTPDYAVPVHSFALRCTACGRTYHYDLQNIMVNKSEKPVILDIIQCKGCGSIETWELTGSAEMALLAEMARVAAILKEDTESDIETPLISGQDVRLEALGRKVGSPTEAYHLLKDELAAHPDNAAVQKSMGTLLKNGSRPELALPYLLEADRLAPDDADTLCSISIRLVDMQRHREAIPYLERLVPLCRESKMAEKRRREMFSILLELTYSVKDTTGHRIELFSGKAPQEWDRVMGSVINCLQNDVDAYEEIEKAYLLFRDGKLPEGGMKKKAGRIPVDSPEDDTEDEYIEDRKPPQPVVNAPKVGRNDPCPCGSGKKYKKCCGK